MTDVPPVIMSEDPGYFYIEPTKKYNQSIDQSVDYEFVYISVCIMSM